MRGRSTDRYTAEPRALTSRAFVLAVSRDVRTGTGTGAGESWQGSIGRAARPRRRGLILAVASDKRLPRRTEAQSAVAPLALRLAVIYGRITATYVSRRASMNECLLIGPTRRAMVRESILAPHSGAARKEQRKGPKSIPVSHAK